MQASFLRASLFTSVVAFGVAALATVLGILLVLIGGPCANRSLPPRSAPPPCERTPGWQRRTGGAG